jgi:hypothetical protein
MKYRKIGFFLAVAAVFFSLSGCSGKPDADVLMREAKTNAGAIQSCTASYNNRLAFTANGKENVCETGSEIVYCAKPFALKSTQTSLLGGESSKSTSYTVTDEQGVWFYTETDGAWQKTSAGNIDTSPTEQVDILRLLQYVTSQKYVRETTIDSKKVQKLEIAFDKEVLRSTIETIVTATGMGEGSQTVVQTLLDSAGDLYGYCYIDASSGEIVRMELDATGAVNDIFKNIAGSDITVNISKCIISGDISDLGNAAKVELPPQADAAQDVSAAG